MMILLQALLQEKWCPHLLFSITIDIWNSQQFTVARAHCNSMGLSINDVRVPLQTPKGCWFAHFAHCFYGHNLGGGTTMALTTPYSLFQKRSEKPNDDQGGWLGVSHSLDTADQIWAKHQVSIQQDKNPQCVCLVSSYLDDISAEIALRCISFLVPFLMVVFLLSLLFCVVIVVAFYRVPVVLAVHALVDHSMLVDIFAVAGVVVAVFIFVVLLTLLLLLAVAVLLWLFLFLLGLFQGLFQFLLSLVLLSCVSCSCCSLCVCCCFVIHAVLSVPRFLRATLIIVVVIALCR